MSRLTAQGLVKRYRGRNVVASASLQLKAGEVVGLLGPNGAGKTTCFYMLVGLIPPDSGQILLGEHEVTDAPMHTRAHLGLGYLTQEPSVFRGLSVAENVTAILELRRNLDRVQRREECERLLHEFSLHHLADNSAAGLSGGERRRLEIARALAAKPRFLLLDEPFAGVDPISVVDVQRIIGQLSKAGIGILITDHNVRETLGICQRAYIMNHGTILTQGTPREILANPEVRSVYLGENFHI